MLYPIFFRTDIEAPSGALFVSAVTQVSMFFLSSCKMFVIEKTHSIIHHSLMFLVSPPEVLIHCENGFPYMQLKTQEDWDAVVLTFKSSNSNLLWLPRTMHPQKIFKNFWSYSRP